MGKWPYAARLVKARGSMSRAAVANEISKLANRTIAASMVKNWESGSTPRCASIVEQWIRSREPVKPMPQPRDHVAVSVSCFLDTLDIDEAGRMISMLEGVADVINARRSVLLSQRLEAATKAGAIDPVGDNAERDPTTREKRS